MAESACDRWMLVGAYVGFATVGAFCVWYMYDNVLGLDLSADGHSTVTFSQLRNWEQCRSWPDFKASIPMPCLWSIKSRWPLCRG